MNTFKIASLFCLSWLMVGCNDNLFHRVKLISPANRSEVEPGALTFTWKTKDDAPVRFRLGTEDFRRTLKDTTFAGNTITYRDGLASDSSYVWKVEQGESENSSRFHVVDVAARFEGEHLGVARTFAWMMGGPSRDTSYSAQIRLQKEGNGMKVTGDRELLLPYSGVTDSSIQYTYPFSTSQNAQLNLNYQNGAVHLSLFSGGLGGGTRYWFDAAN